MALPPSHGFVPAPAGLPALIDTARRAFTDPVLVGLFVIGGCSMGALVALFNTLGFRLEGAPFDLGLAAASLVYLVYPLGTVSSSLFGSLADRRGQRAVLPLGAVVAVGGAVLTLSSWLPAVIVGVALVTVGFFAVHGIASGWVPARAHAGGVAVGQAASFYLFVYYVGSSLFGSLGHERVERPRMGRRRRADHQPVRRRGRHRAVLAAHPSLGAPGGVTQQRTPARGGRVRGGAARDAR